MGKIVQYIKNSRPRRDRSKDVKVGNVVIFPGVRYERTKSVQNPLPTKHTGQGKHL